MNTPTVVEDTAGRLFSVVPAPDGLEHVWTGLLVKLVHGQFVPRANTKAVLVRKAGCRVVSLASLTQLQPTPLRQPTPV